MGVDGLDLMFRLERSFGIKVPKTFFHEDCSLSGKDMQVSQVYAGVLKVFSRENRPVPFSSWHRTQVCVAQATGKPIREVKPGAWLVKDLGICW